MPSTFLKPTTIVSAGLGLLSRETTLSRLVWRNPVGSFAGALNDTISIRVPAYATARTRALRSASARTRDSLYERKVDVTLDTDVYKDVRITDEELTLDIRDFGAQVLNPVMEAVARKLDDTIAAEITGATYRNEISYDYSAQTPWENLILPARRFLNDAQVPQGGRVLLVGSGVESEILADDHFVRADASGSTDALRDATIGRVAGFTVVTSSAIDPDTAYAFHSSAFVMSTAAPIVPAGAPYGAATSAEGFAMRVVRVMDSATIEDILAVDAWVGTSVVTDAGYYTSSGLFVPAEPALGSNVTLATSAASDDIIDTAAPHGFVAGDRVVFTALTGGTGLVTNREYFVVATSLGASTFRVAATSGGTPIDFSADITAGTVRSGGTDLFVRAVKVTAVP